MAKGDAPNVSRLYMLNDSYIIKKKKRQSKINSVQ
jgi:hypothetical protein